MDDGTTCNHPWDADIHTDVLPRCHRLLGGAPAAEQGDSAAEGATAEGTPASGSAAAGEPLVEGTVIEDADDAPAGLTSRKKAAAK